MLSGVALCAVLAVVLVSLLVRLRRRGGETDDTDTNVPPSAPDALPIVGHALSYRKDPAGFLRRVADRCGGVFSLNLAGFKTTVLCDRSALECFAVAPESVLSAREATAAFGFAETLGRLSVDVGTGVHRRLIKSAVLPRLFAADGEGLLALHTAIAHNVRHVFSGDAQEAASASGTQGGGTAVLCPDVFRSIREVVLRTSVAELLGYGLLRRCGAWLVPEFMAFQDMVEDATAAALPLPALLANLLVLGPVRRARERLMRRLAPEIAREWAGSGAEYEGGGQWLGALRERQDQLRAEAAAGSQLADPLHVAELAIGLLFAAHKNPAIGAAQCLVTLLEPGNAPFLAAAVREARSASVPCDAKGWAALGGAGQRGREHGLGYTLPVLDACLHETLRLAGHTIGALRKVRPPGGFSVRNSAGRTFVLPQGSFVAASHIVPHLDATVFSKPTNFDPGRFAAAPGHSADGAFAGQRKAGSCAERFDDYTFTTFSHGTHRCPGRNYARALMLMTLWVLLSEFEISPSAPLPPVSFARATLAQRLGPCQIVHRRRKSR